MIREELNQRLEDLHNVLSYCSELQNYGKIYVFKVNERICINQERGSLLSQLNSNNFPHEVRTYVIPASIEAKVKFTLEKIESTNWGGFTTDHFFKNKK